MKGKKIALLVLFVILIAGVLGLAACKGPKDCDMSGISFTDKSFVYDGKAKTLEITGTLPEGVTVAYEYYLGETKVEEAKDAGVYTVKAVFTVDEKIYNTVKPMTAKLTISYNMAGITLTGTTVVYDGSAKTLEIAGILPEGVTVAYEYYLGETKVTEAKNAGEYTVKAVFSGAQEVAIDDLTAKLTINKADPFVTFGANKRLENNDEVDLDQDLVLQQDGDGYYYEFDGNQYVLGVIDSNVAIASKDIAYYTQLNPDGTVNDDYETIENTLMNVGDSLYIVVNVKESENYNAKTFTAKITMNKKVVRISNYEELCTLNSDTSNLPKSYRLNIIYVLQNDIDCNGAVWKSIATTFGSDALPFCSEFDGNGFTISNFKLTNESIEEANLSHTHGLHVGFFGYLVDAYVHDVNFENVTANITRDGYERIDMGGNCLNPIYFGVVAGRMECDGSNGGESDLENITVKNTVINLRGYKIYAGTIIGMDHAVNDGVKRNNLKAENVELYAMSSHDYADKTFVGGIVGRTQGSDVIVYNNCSVKDIKLGYDQVKWNEVHNSTYNPKNDYIPNLNAENIVGAFVGQVDGTSITFNDSHVLGDWRICSNKSLGYFGWSSKMETDYETWISTFTNLNINNCTHTAITSSLDDLTKGFFWAGMTSSTPNGWGASNLTTNGWCNQYEPKA